MDGASTPPGTSETATQGTCAARNSADIVNFGCTALIGGAAGVLGLIQKLTQVADALRVEGGGLGQTGLEVENTAGFFEAVDGALAEEKTLCLDGECGQELGLELANGDAQEFGDFFPSISLLLGKESEGCLDDRVDLGFKRVAEAALLAHELMVEISQTISQRAVVLLESQAVLRGQNDGSECAFSHTQVVVTGCGFGLVGSDETLCHEEGDILIGLGDRNMLDVECREELGVEQVSPAGEDGSSLVHTVVLLAGYKSKQIKPQLTLQSKHQLRAPKPQRDQEGPASRHRGRSPS